MSDAPQNTPVKQDPVPLTDTFGAVAAAGARGRSPRPLLALSCLLAAILIYLRVSLPSALDDAYITFLYARNLAEGKGFIYTPRYPTWGTTTPLFTLLLGLLGRLSAFPHLGLSDPAAQESLSRVIPAAARLLDGGAMVLQIVGACLVFRLLRLSRWQPLVIVAIPALVSLFTTFPGMEYGLFGACCVGAVACVAGSRWTMAALLASAAATLRIDGAWVWLVTLAAYLLHTRGRWRPVVFGIVLTALPLMWHLFALVHFGRLTPQTLAVRQLEATVWGTFGGFWWRQFLFPDGHWRGVCIPFLLGLTLACRRHPRMAWFAVFFAGYVALYAGMGIPGLHLYLCPLNLIVLIFVCAGLGLIGQALYPVFTRPVARGLVYAVLLLGVLACLWLDLSRSNLFWRLAPTAGGQHDRLFVYKGIALWMRDHLPPGTCFATNEIGVLGYFSRQDIAEIGGLVNHEGLPYVPQRYAALTRRIGAPILVLHKGFFETIRKGEDGRVFEQYDVLAALEGDDRETINVFVKKGFMNPAERRRQLELLEEAVRAVDRL